MWMANNGLNLGQSTRATQQIARQLPRNPPERRPPGCDRGIWNNECPALAAPQYVVTA